MVKPSNLTVQCGSCEELVQPEKPPHRRRLIIGFMAVFGGVGFLIGTSIGIATAGSGTPATIPLGLIGLYAGYATGDSVAERLNGYTCPECEAKIGSGSDTGITDFREGLQKQTTSENRCVECGETIEGDTKVCPNCDVRQPTLTRAGETNRVTAGILAVLLGVIGIHKFYQRNVKLGLIYLILGWTLIPALLGVIEGILMLIADEETYRRKYADGSFLGI